MKSPLSKAAIITGINTIKSKENICVYLASRDAFYKILKDKIISSKSMEIMFESGSCQILDITEKCLDNAEKIYIFTKDRIMSTDFLNHLKLMHKLMSTICANYKMGVYLQEHQKSFKKVKKKNIFYKEEIGFYNFVKITLDYLKFHIQEMDKLINESVSIQKLNFSHEDNERYQKAYGFIIQNFS